MADLLSAGDFDPTSGKIHDCIRKLWYYKELSNAQLAGILGIKRFNRGGYNIHWEDLVYKEVTTVSILFPSSYPGFNVVRLPYRKGFLRVTDDPDLIMAYGIIPRANRTLTKVERLVAESLVISANSTSPLQHGIATEIEHVLRDHRVLSNKIVSYQESVLEK